MAAASEGDWSPARRMIAAADALGDDRLGAAAEGRQGRWPEIERLIALARDYEQARYAPLRALWKQTEERLPTWLRPDPAREDWASFRPLRLSREEDWADWLGHLLQTCPDGELHRALFCEELGTRVRTHREECVDWEGATPDDLPNLQPGAGAGGYRVDLVLEGEMGSVHVEVKVGDPSLRKTWPTALALRSGDHHMDLGSEILKDYLLLLPSQRSDAFADLRREMGARYGFDVEAITWHEVALELRRILASRTAPDAWSPLARVFLGAIEQKLLKHPHLDSAGEDVVSGDAKAAASYLQEVISGD